MNFDKKILIQKISNIKSKSCYMKLFKLVHDAGISYTVNSNGVFFNIDLLNEDDLNKILQIVIFYENKKNTLINNRRLT